MDEFVNGQKILRRFKTGYYRGNFEEPAKKIKNESQILNILILLMLVYVLWTIIPFTTLMIKIYQSKAHVIEIDMNVRGEADLEILLVLISFLFQYLVLMMVGIRLLCDEGKFKYIWIISVTIFYVFTFFNASFSDMFLELFFGTAMR